MSSYILIVWETLVCTGRDLDWEVKDELHSQALCPLPAVWLQRYLQYAQK